MHEKVCVLFRSWITYTEPVVNYRLNRSATDCRERKHSEGTDFHWLSFQSIMVSSQVSKEIFNELEAAHSGAVAAVGRAAGG